MVVSAEVVNLALYYIGGHSDGWTKESAKKELIRIKNRTSDPELKDYIKDILKKSNPNFPREILSGITFSQDKTIIFW